MSANARNSSGASSRMAVAQRLRHATSTAEGVHDCAVAVSDKESRRGVTYEMTSC
jgi:tellurite resistance protein